MKKDRFYKDFTYEEISNGYSYMSSELKHLPKNHFLIVLFDIVWKDFKENKFKYDGATFVRERSNQTIFEFASFVHDWLNSLGYVGKKVDDLFIDIMITLNYEFSLIFERYLLMRCFTWVNVLRHKYILKDLKKGLPPYHFELPEIYINPYTN